MSLDKTIRENLNGEYLIIHSNQLREGVEYAKQIKIPQIQLRGALGHQSNNFEVDFKELEKLSDSLKIISLSTLENVVNLESIYTLRKLKKLYLDKQKFTIDISNFPEIEHLGSEYWKGLINFSKAYSLQSLVLLKLPYLNLEDLSKLSKLETLHVYSSKIKTLEGIEKLALKKLSLVRNNSLEDIQSIKELNTLNELLIEKCKKITDYTFLDDMKSKINIRIIN